LPTVVPVVQALPSSLGTSLSLDLTALSGGEIRHAPDGWHALLRMRGIEHRLWLAISRRARMPPIGYGARSMASRQAHHFMRYRLSGVTDWRWRSAPSMRE